ncbi:hypothetical protein C8J56DRAFT_1041725 [Mycena floridula]|nr:hypothetical protein C8J56DRAFT_1041725 [Mycena floridula]
MGIAPPGYPAGPEGVLYSCLPRPRDSKRTPVPKLPKSDASVSRARLTKDSDIDNSHYLASATTNSLTLNAKQPSTIEPNHETITTEGLVEPNTMDTQPDFTVQVLQPPAVDIDAPSFPTNGIPGMTAFTVGAISPRYSPAAPSGSVTPQDVSVDPKSIMPLEPHMQDQEEFEENLSGQEEEYQ